MDERVEILEKVKTYPESRMFGRLPSYGFYCRHVTGLRMRNLEFKSAAAEARPVIFCDDVKDLDIAGLRSAPIVGTQPVIKLVQTRKALLQNCSAPAGTKTFLEVQGDKTEDVVLMNSHLGATEQATKTGADGAKATPPVFSLSGNISKVPKLKALVNF